MPARTLSRDEFETLKTQVLDAAPKGLSEAEFNRYVGPAMEQALGTAENSPEPLTESAASRFASGVWRMVSPWKAVEAAMDVPGTVKGILDAHAAQLEKARTAFNEGNYWETVGHLAGGLLPILGPAAAGAGERMATGDVAGGLGEGAALVGTVSARPALKATGRGVNRLATKLATSEKAQQAVGATAGAVAGGSAGHPYIGMAIGGKYGGPVVRSAAEMAENLTGGRAPAPPSAPLSDLEFARQEAAAGRLDPKILDAMERAAKKPPTAPTPPKTPPPAPSRPSPPSTPAAETTPTTEPIATPTPTPKPTGSPMSQMWQAKEKLGVTLNAVQMMEGAKLVRQGMTPEQAIKALKPELPEAWQGTPTDEEVGQVVAAKNTGVRDVRARKAKQTSSGNPFR